MAEIKRDSYFDFLRGIAIIMVIGIHCFWGIDIKLTPSVCMLLALRQFENCAVPIFLAISGYFMAKKIDKIGRENYFSYFYKQSLSIYLPMLIWSLPLFFLDMRNGQSFINHIVLLLVGGYSVYYFVILIIQCYAIVPLLANLNFKGLILSVIISFLSLGLVEYYTNIMGNLLPLVVSFGLVPVWGMFFVLGYYLYRREKEREYSTLPYFIIMAIGFILSFVELNILSTHFRGGVGIKLSAFVYSSGVIMIIFNKKVRSKYKQTWATNSICRIGDISFAIYLTHFFVIQCLRSLHINSYLILWLMTLLLVVTLIKIAKYILPVKIQVLIGIR